MGYKTLAGLTGKTLGFHTNALCERGAKYGVDREFALQAMSRRVNVRNN